MDDSIYTFTKNIMYNTYVCIYVYNIYIQDKVIII